MSLKTGDRESRAEKWPIRHSCWSRFTRKTRKIMEDLADLLLRAVMFVLLLIGLVFALESAIDHLWPRARQAEATSPAPLKTEVSREDASKPRIRCSCDQRRRSSSNGSKNLSAR